MTDEQARHIGDMVTSAVNASVLSIATLAKAFRELAAQAPPPDRWVLMMRPATYRQLWHTRKPMQRKLARMVSSKMRPAPRHNVRPH